MSSVKDQLKYLLQRTTPVDLSSQLGPHACVAILLRGDSMEDLEIAFIQRAIRAEDRWSGQLAFPGGKREEFDVTDLDGAIRETFEEVGIVLSKEALVGRIDDVQGRKAGSLLDFYIRPFVFYYPETNYTLNLQVTEVADFFWISLKELNSTVRKTTYKVDRMPGIIELPAVALDRDVPLWGLTYMMCLNLFERLRP